MRKDPLNPKYTKIEARVDPIIREVIRIAIIGQTVETEDSMEIIGLDNIIEIIIFKEILEDMEDKIEEENIEMICVMIIIEAGIGQEKGHLQEIMVIIRIEVPVTVDQGQDLELVQIEIG